MTEAQGRRIIDLLEKLVLLAEKQDADAQRRHDRLDRLKVAELGKLDTVIEELKATEWEPETRER